MKTNILHMLAANFDDPIAGGVGSALRSWVRYLSKDEFKVTVVLPIANELAKELIASGLDVAIVDTRTVGLRDTVGKIAKILKDKAIQVVHVQEIRSLFFVVLAIRSIKGEIKIVYTRQGITVSGIFPLKIRLKKRLYLLLERFLCKRYVDFLTSVSAIVSDEIVKYLGIKPEKIIMLENRVDIDYLWEKARPAEDIRKELGFSDKEKIIGMAKRLVYEKGVSYFIRAAKEVSKKNGNTRFIVVGEGPDRKMFEELIEELELKDIVRLIGFKKDMGSYINVMDIFCHPTIGTEGLPIVVVEAMAFQKPVISTHIGVSGVIEDGVNGIIVPIMDGLALSSAMLRLLENPDLAFKYGRKAAEKALKTFHIQKSVDIIEGIYRSCIATATHH